jgi:L-lactate utilization protein LutC
MPIAELERPAAVDDLVERAGDTASTIAGDVEELVADVRKQSAEAGNDLAAETRRATDATEFRTGAAVFVAALLAIAMSGLIVLMRRRAARVREQL